MSTVEETVARLEALIQQQQEQIVTLQTQPQVDPALLAQLRNGMEAALDAPPRSYPEGAIPGDRRPKAIRKREMAIAKMQAVAKARGGIWSPDTRIPRIYGHRGLDPKQPDREACPSFGSDQFEKTCQRTCWTPETETRFLHALGLKELASSTLVPLTPPDPKGNRDAILELVGLLKGQQSTERDAYGRYPSPDETGDVSPDTRRKVRTT